MAHEVEHTSLNRYLESKGLKQTKQREAILDVFLEATGHITSEELYARVRDRFPHIGYTTVYRTMSSCARPGWPREHFDGGVTRYEIPTSTTITSCARVAGRSSNSSAR
jgi:Fur family ferric uptake transcriptional regulator